MTRAATTNAVRHGGASKLSLCLSASEGRLRLTVADDGRGFDRTAFAAGRACAACATESKLWVDRCTRAPVPVQGAGP